MPNKDLFSLDDLTESAPVPTGDDGDGASLGDAAAFAGVLRS